MSSIARRHHFLPQGYLAGFTDTGRKDGKPNVLDIKTKKSFRTSPLNVAVEKDFKRIDLEQTPIDAVETALAPIEDQAIQAIRRVTQLESFPSDSDHNLILNLLSLMVAQNPKSRRNLNRARTHEADEKLERLVASQANWEKHISLAEKAGEKPNEDIDYERARLFVDKRRYTIEFSTEGTLREEFRAQNELLSALGKRIWTVLIAPKIGPYFICSDYPFSLVMEHGFHGQPTFLTENTEFFFPLSKTVGFIGILGTALERVVNISPTAIALMNRRVLRQADQRLFLTENKYITYKNKTIVTVHI